MSRDSWLIYSTDIALIRWYKMTVAAFFNDYKIAISNLNAAPVAASSEIQGDSQLSRKYLRMSTDDGTADFLCSGTLSHIRAMTEAFGVHNRESKPSNTEYDIAELVIRASEHARSAGYSDFELLGLCNSQSFVLSSRSERLRREYPYFGSVSTTGEDARRFSELLTFMGMELASTTEVVETVECRRERIASWLPFMLMEHDRSLETSSRSIASGRYYEVYDFESGTLQPLGSTLTASISLPSLAGSPEATISSLHFHVYLGDSLSVLVLNEPTSISRVDGVELPYEAFSVYSAGELLCAESQRPTSRELMLRLLASPSLTRFALSGPRASGPNCGVFYSSPRRLFKVTPGDGLLMLKLDQETFNSNVDRLLLDISPRSHSGFSQSRSATPVFHNYK